ncbi:DPP IV N-terminal domain-containing protein [Sphingobacterium oryzagri]|uniref:DPP IV N-terminal domain-containing protein n=1 Tax=Sphingobacterium oryzagri TaxID=3025669 RepID=A0ABY7WNI3_9SPHI|nr:DPP IV N-terminal domain-containing protein [Sphingobacterium sp. KACC 22765]WDF69865.1 DPP IV N-terminal domain-containing protein [Sphingobacterium sp. KACC 22765]
MKKLLILFLFGSSLAYGQRNFTIEETVYGPRQFAPQSLVLPQWLPQTDAFSTLDASYQKLTLRDAQSSWQSRDIATIEDISTALQSVLNSNESVKLSYFPLDYSWADKDHIAFAYEADSWKYTIRYAVKTKQAQILTKSPADGAQATSTTDYSKVAYLVDNNIEISSKEGKRTIVTQDSLAGIVNGSDYTHRQEFGISKGMWWSPDNEKLLYYRKDESMVSNYPLIQWDKRVAATKDIRYPMAGMKSEEVTLRVYDSKTSSHITLQTGEPKEQYLTICTWDPSSKYIYVGILNREQNHLKVNKYDATDGHFIQTLFEEKSESWVEPLHALTFLPNKPDQFLYQTDKDGFNQLYLYDVSGKLLRSLGYEDVIVEDVQGFSSDGKKVIYTGITNKGLDRQLFEVAIATGKTQQLTNKSGTHRASLSANGNYVLDQFSNLNTANNVDVYAVKGGKPLEIIRATNPFEGKISLPKIEAVSLVSADGQTPLNGRIIYPANFDGTKKYPVMVYLYGGSHAQLVQNKWLYGAGYFDLYMAQQGYIVFTMDNRGSDARGRDFTRITHRQLGQAEMADQLKGIDFLKSKSFVDQSRMGIFGWSFGGFMTTSFMVQHPGIFQTAVAGGPVIDWKYYEVMYGERYMDTPQENPEGYQKAGLLDKAKQLAGNLLIIHGAQDPVVVQQHSMEFIEACIKAGKQVDYFLYPTHEHNVMGKDRIHMYDKIAKYFDLHLKK